MKIYLSGPMSGLPDYNFPAFEFAAKLLRDTGNEVLSAHEIHHEDNGEPGSLPWSQYLKGDLVEMLYCDAICMLPGWENSRGATLELFVATQVGMKVSFLKELGMIDHKYILHRVDL